MSKLFLLLYITLFMPESDRYPINIKELQADVYSEKEVEKGYTTKDNRGYLLSEKSNKKLLSCHPDLQKLIKEVSLELEFVVLTCHRDKHNQDKAYTNGFSKLRYPSSKHNSSPSRAVDIAPKALKWHDIESFENLAVIVKMKAKELRIDVSWGGDWNWKDYSHWELTNNN